MPPTRAAPKNTYSGRSVEKILASLAHRQDQAAMCPQHQVCRIPTGADASPAQNPPVRSARAT